MELIFVKCISAASLLTLTLLFAILPLIIWRNDRSTGINNQYSTRLLSLLSCAGGGVFLGTCFLHLLPEVQEQMATVFQMLQMKQTFPTAEFLMTFGFLIILVTEQIILVFQSQSEEEIPFLHHHHDHANSIHNSYGTASPSLENRPTMEPNHSVHEDHSSHSPLRSIVLVFALSLHSLFEGFAIGLQSSADNVIRILVAVFIHKSVIAFTLGLNLIHSKLKKSALAWSVGTFVTMSPVGVVIGSIITDFSQGFNVVLTSGILQGIAAGTFVYVTFFEILPHEMNSMNNKLWKVLSLIVGFSFISLLILYVPS